MTEAVLFYLFSLVAVMAGLGVVLARSPITSALSLVTCFFFLAADYVLLDAHFVAVIQLLVYAGAIMVLFIFVIMLLNLREGSPTAMGGFTPRTILGACFAGLMAVGLAAVIGVLNAGPVAPEVQGEYGTIAQVGNALFASRYLLPFESVSVLLTVAVIGAVVLAKKEL